MLKSHKLFEKNTKHSLYRGFTLIELLVVIAIIAVLMGILVPSLRKAREQAKKVECRSNMKQVGTAIAMYQASYTYNFRIDTGWKTRQGAGWDFKNGTADHAHEWQPTFAKDIMENNLLPDRKVFFCPSVRNVAYNKNYLSNAMQNSHNTLSYDTAYIEQNYPNDHPVFWSTHNWIWKKRVTSGTPQVNRISAGAMLCDMSPSAWEHIGASNIYGFNFVHELNIIQTVEHYNVLMDDLSVVNPSDHNREVNQWLWGTDEWPVG